MRTICLHDRKAIKSFLKPNSLLHVYSLACLDEPFWGFTTWYALQDEEEIQALALLYSGLRKPILIAIGLEEQEFMRELLRSLSHLLPRRFEAQISGDLAKVLEDQYKLTARQNNYRLALTNRNQVVDMESSDAEPLGRADLDELRSFYAASFSEHQLERDMLDTGQYFAIREGGQMIAAAGVHVYSDKYKVAAIGNVASLPEVGTAHRSTVVAALCQNLLKSVNKIVLDVPTTDEASLASYHKLGFEVIATFEEVTAGPV